MRCIKPLAPSRNETNSSRVNGGADKLCAIPQICAYGGQDQVGFDCLTQKSPLPAAVRHRRRGRIGVGSICDACRAYCNLTCPATPPSVGLLLHDTPTSVTASYSSARRRSITAATPGRSQPRRSPAQAASSFEGYGRSLSGSPNPTSLARAAKR